MKIDAQFTGQLPVTTGSSAYTLAPGESFESVLEAFSLSERDLLDLNPSIRIPALVGPGDALMVPSGQL